MTTISSENLTLVTIVTFLGVFFILVASMPAGLVLSNEMQKGKIVSVPSYFESVDIQNFAETYSVNVTKEMLSYFVFGGWNMRFEHWGIADNSLNLATYDSWWIFKWNYKFFHWHDYQGIDQTTSISFMRMVYLPLQKIDEAYVNTNKSKEGLRWTCQNDNTELVAFIGFNETAYDLPSEALENDDLHILLAMNMDKINTTFNAWNLIGTILFFQMPNVHSALNMIIAIPIWILIAWLIYILILKAIPFVGG